MSWRRSRLYYAGVGAGVALFFYGLTIPVYGDMAAARELKLNACRNGKTIPLWHEQMAALETLRHPFMQAGVSLGLATLTILALASLFASDDGSKMLTPKSRGTFIGLGLLTIAISYFSQLHSLSLDLDRGVFPHCADSIGIPMIGFTITYGMLTLICLAAGALLVGRFKRLPRPLFNWDRQRPVISTLYTAGAVVLALPVVALGIAGAIGSSFAGTPAVVLAVYLILSARAALIDRARE